MRVLLLLLFFVSCLPKEVSQTARCGDNEEFNSETRKCYSVIGAREVPETDLRVVNLIEDGGTQSVDISYTDSNGNKALGCTLYNFSTTIDGDGASPPSCSCEDGVCSAYITPDTHFNGISEFRYYLTDIDGDSIAKLVQVNVSAVDDAPIVDILSTFPFQGYQLNEDISVNYSLGYVDYDNDLASECELTAISENLEEVSSCECLLGSCDVRVKGKQDAYSDGEYFTYRIKSNGVWSERATMFLDILPVNDLPSVPSDITVTLVENSPYGNEHVVLDCGVIGSPTTAPECSGLNILSGYCYDVGAPSVNFTSHLRDTLFIILIPMQTLVTFQLEMEVMSMRKIPLAMEVMSTTIA